MHDPMHDAAHLSGGSSPRPTLEPHHYTDSTSPRWASWRSHSNLHSYPAAPSHRANSGRRQASFREIT